MTWASNNRKPMRRGGKLRAIGKKGRENARVVREKKREHLRLGLTSCELRISELCTPFENLAFAHDRKRRHMGKWGTIERAENLRESALSCNFCHDEAELKGESKMQPIINRVIADRANRQMEAA